MHAHAWHMSTRTAHAYLALGASAGGREAGGGSGGRGSKPTASDRRAAAVGDEGGDARATCEGRDGPRLVRDHGVAGEEGR